MAYYGRMKKPKKGKSVYQQKKGKDGKPFPTPYLSKPAFKVVRAKLQKTPNKWHALD